MHDPAPDFSPGHWLKLARKVREQACKMKDPLSKDELEAIAHGYERLADHAAKRQTWSRIKR
jgi:hypothetical protein